MRGRLGQVLYAKSHRNRMKNRMCKRAFRIPKREATNLVDAIKHKYYNFLESDWSVMMYSSNCRFFLCIRGKRSSEETNVPRREKDPGSTDNHLTQKQINKTKKLISVVRAQNSLLRLLASKVDPQTDYSELLPPEAEIDGLQGAYPGIERRAL